MQSRALVWVVLLILTPFCLFIVGTARNPYRSGLWVFRAVGVSLTFGVIVWALRAATPAAALCGSMICFQVILGTWYVDASSDYSGLGPLIALFLLTFASTKAGKRRKVQLGVAEGRRGRSASQVVANLGMAGLVPVGGSFAGLLGFSDHAVPVLVLAALCEASADTVSSEIGQAFGGQPFMLTTLRRVEPGTDGAVSLTGTAAGFLGAAIVAAVGVWAMQMKWQSAAIGFAGGITGWLVDSLLGATVERRGWLGNDLVNFLSTVFAAGVAWALLQAR
jgi:uncharacterized protein (TIGR00297 family)